MATDPRILARFQEEFAASQGRLAEIRSTTERLSQEIDNLNARAADEVGIQDAINAVLTQLGETAL